MISEIHLPVDPLNQFIDHFYYYSGYNPEHLIDKFLPDGEVQIIFDLTEDPKFIYHNETLEAIQSCRRVWFSGFRTVPITIPSGKESEMLIVQFKKGKAHYFLNAPMDQFTNQVVDAELVLKPEILNIRHALQSAATIQEKFKRLEENFLQEKIWAFNKFPFIDFALNYIMASPSSCTIKEVSAKSGYSQKHIISLFREQVGVTPKEFLKVIRFQKAIQKINQQRSIDWSAVAYDCGFYDQSHFISDFKAFSGYTPTDYLKAKGVFLNYIPLP